MKAIVLKDFGGITNLVYEETPTPEVGTNDVLIRLHMAAVNHLDIDVRRGISGLPVALPHILGTEGAGEVAAVGQRVTNFRPGDRVATFAIQACGHCANCTSGHENTCLNLQTLGGSLRGTYAEYVKVDARQPVPLPDDLSFETAVAGFKFGVAHEALVLTAKLRPGETILVTGAGGGVGSSAVQYAMHLGGKVIAATGLDEKCQRALALGAEHAINYLTEDLSEAVLDRTDGRGVDVAFDMSGGKVLQHCLSALAPGGRLATVGAHAGERVEIDMIEVFRKHLSIFGCGRMTRSIVARMFDLMASGKIEPVIHRRFGLKDVAEAHAIMESRRFFGRMLLEP